MAVRTFIGGIHPVSCKFTGDSPIVAGKLPAKLTVPVGPAWVGYTVLVRVYEEIRVRCGIVGNRNTYGVGRVSLYGREKCGMQ